jgi:hypothetical protein
MNTIDIAARADLATIRRFVWKEYRMLRGLWLAVAVMGVLAQIAMQILMPPQPAVDHATMLFSAALTAAIVYAVGAAATAFSVEHEEETYSYLLGLPATWWPAFAGKLLVSTVSAAALAGILSITGWIFCGFDTPGAHDTPAALGVFGMAIVEALAWGTFFSLLVKRPLVAAMLTLIVASVVINIAVVTTSAQAVAGLDPGAYVQALPWRLAIVAVVFLCDVLIARQWLVVRARPVRSIRVQVPNLLTLSREGLQSLKGRIGYVATKGARRRLLLRLLWQSWRESWKLILLPLLIGVVLFAGMSAFLALFNRSDEVMLLLLVASPLFVPALYGSMSFYADQRRGSYRFLAEHAARPRYVWLARHIVWLGTFVLISAALTYVVFGLFAALVHRSTGQMLDQMLRGGRPYGIQYPAAQVEYDIHQGVSYAIAVALLGALGSLTAYAIGQLFSMVLRSEIVAAFISLVCSVVLGGWLITLFLWQLSGWVFLLPLAAALMLATWLRAPDWIAGRNSSHAWWKPAAAVFGTFSVVGLLLPLVRIEQVPRTVEFGSPRDGDTPQARETATLYFRAVQRSHNLGADDPLERWNDLRGPEGVDEKQVPLEQLDAFDKAKQKWQELVDQAEADAIAATIAASKRPACRFSFNVRDIAPSPANQGPKQRGLEINEQYRDLCYLQDRLITISKDMPEDQAIERFIAALRMSSHIRAGQPSIVCIDQFVREQKILQEFGQWALADGRTKEALRSALEKLRQYFRTAQPSLEAALLADRELVRDAIEGKSTPLVLSQTPLLPDVYMAYLANELAWERKRGLLVVDLITRINIDESSNLVHDVSWTGRPAESQGTDLRRWLRPVYATGLPQIWEITQPSTTTSYLATMEYKTRVPFAELLRAYCDMEVCRRAALLEIGLAMYRLDHHGYPPRLADLVPAYLDKMPLDPYSGQSFQYEPAGLDRPLQGRFQLENGFHSETRTIAVGDTQTIAVADTPTIAANTPLFWSVSTGNVRLIEAYGTSYEAAYVDQPEGEAREVLKPNYTLMTDEPEWWNDPVYVFSLPK